MLYFVFKVYHYVILILICYIETYIYEYIWNQCKIQKVDAINRQGKQVQVGFWFMRMSGEHSSPRCYPLSKLPAFSKLHLMSLILVWVFIIVAIDPEL